MIAQNDPIDNPSGAGAQLYVAVDAVTLDGRAQSREAIDGEIVAEYAEAMKAGETFPPVVAYWDGDQYWLADGFHRVHAARRAGLREMPALIYDGGLRDAILYAAGSNATHGLRRTNKDKRRAVRMLLRDAEWATWPLREIARRCGVSEGFVHKVHREGSSVHGEQMKPAERTVARGGRTYTMDTAAIGKGRKKAATKPEPKPTLESKATEASNVVQFKPDEGGPGIIPKDEVMDCIVDVMLRIQSALRILNASQRSDLFSGLKQAITNFEDAEAGAPAAAQDAPAEAAGTDTPADAKTAPASPATAAPAMPDDGLEIPACLRREPKTGGGR